MFEQILYLKLTIIAFAIFIAYQIARLGKKRLAGFNWAFFFGLFMPIVAIIIVLLNKKKDHPQKRTHPLIKALAILLIIYGSLFIVGIFKPAYNIPKSTELQKSGKANVQDDDSFNWMYEYSHALGNLVGGGILTVFVSSESYEIMDYSAARVMGFNIGLFIVLLGAFLLRKKKITKDKESTIGHEKIDIDTSSSI